MLRKNFSKEQGFKIPGTDPSPRHYWRDFFEEKNPNNALGRDKNFLFDQCVGGI